MNALDNILLENNKSDVKNLNSTVSKPKGNDNGFKKLVHDKNENQSSNENVEKNNTNEKKVSSDKESYPNKSENNKIIIGDNVSNKDTISKLIDDSDLDQETKDKLISLFEEDNNDLNIKELNDIVESNNVDIEFVSEEKNITNDKNVIVTQLVNENTKKDDIKVDIETTDENKKSASEDIKVVNKEINNIQQNVQKQTVETIVPIQQNNRNKDEDFSIKKMILENSEDDKKGKNIDVKNSEINNNIDTNKKGSSPSMNQNTNNVVSSQTFGDTLEHLIQKDNKANGYNNYLNNTGNNIQNTEQNIKHNSNLHSSVLEQMNASIKKNIQSDKTEFTIKLKPIELGDINIKLEFAHDGKVQTVINVEKSETLDMLQKDTKTLEKMLKDAGLNNNEFIFNQNKDNNSSKNDFEKTFNRNYGDNNYKDIDGNSELISKIDRNAANNYHDGLLNVVV